MIELGEKQNLIRDEYGITYVELLVVIVILGILTTAFSITMRQVTSSSQQYRAHSQIVTSLIQSSHFLVQRLKNLSRQSRSLPPNFNYKLLGVDGDGKYENQTTVESRPTDKQSVDHLHFHLFLDSADLSSNSASERGVVHFYLSDEPSKHYDAGIWRLILQQNRHTDNLMDSGKVVPKVTPDLQAPDSLERTIGINIDRLSFRYLNQSGNWVNSWDSSTKSGKLPKAIEFSIRAYDPSPPNSLGHADPKWYTSMVSLSPK